jgi:chromosome segregation ATPase
MNEGFFKECMRQYHIFHIRQLRKAQINWQLGQASNEDQKLSLETVECELTKAQQLNTHLQSEIKKLESRLKILDLSHSQRFSNTANQLREKNRSLLQSQMDLEGRKLEMKRLEELLSVAQEKIVDFETKMGFFKAEINKNETLTSENAGLRAKLSDSSNGKALTTIKENPNHLVAQIAELQLLNDSLKMQLGQSLEKRNELEFLLKKSDEGGRRISVLQACLDAKVCYNAPLSISLTNDFLLS